ncbi:MAG TPA: nitrilase-related carbon-nitrogen hydrolase [Candidatus Dormibacteraeota bacterium]|nr:nitrilase-related carbon-nitrogen hydrolase [Candidatus Dormibacteraeota bacterium]
MPRSSRIRLALVQHQPVLGDLGTNLDSACDQIRAEVQAGSELIVFPELSLTGYFLKDLTPETAVSLEGPEVKRLIKATGPAAALVGLVLESDRFSFYNAALLIADGAVRQVHRKVYLPTYGMFDEQRHLAAGDQFEVAELRLGGGATWRVGILICEDLWHPSSAYLLSRAGVDLLLCPSASPGRGVASSQGELGSAASYAALLRTYAELFTVFAVYCNRVGFEEGFHFWGGSRVLGPDGGLVAGPLADDAGVLHAELDRSDLRRARIAYPLLSDERIDVVQRQLGLDADA